VIDTSQAVLTQARELLAKKNEGLFLFYELGDLEGARRYKERMSNIRALLEKYD
jgi:hypothetical protein